MRDGALPRHLMLSLPAFLCMAAVLYPQAITQTITLNSSTLPVTFSPPSLSFSGQIVNTTSGAKAISLKNRQAVPLTIASISVAGDFAQTNNCPLATYPCKRRLLHFLDNLYSKVSWHTNGNPRHSRRRIHQSAVCITFRHRNSLWTFCNHRDPW